MIFRVAYSLADFQTRANEDKSVVTNFERVSKTVILESSYPEYVPRMGPWGGGSIDLFDNGLEAHV